MRSTPGEGCTQEKMCRRVSDSVVLEAEARHPRALVGRQNRQVLRQLFAHCLGIRQPDMRFTTRNDARFAAAAEDYGRAPAVLRVATQYVRQSKTVRINAVGRSSR